MRRLASPRGVYEVNVLHRGGLYTRYALRHIRKHQDDVIILETARGLLKGPFHASWNAQVERDSEAEGQFLAVSKTQTCSCQGACLNSFKSLASCETTCPFSYPFVHFDEMSSDRRE